MHVVCVSGSNGGCAVAIRIARWNGESWLASNHLFIRMGFYIQPLLLYSFHMHYTGIDKSSELSLGSAELCIQRSKDHLQRLPDWGTYATNPSRSV